MHNVATLWVCSNFDCRYETLGNCDVASTKCRKCGGPVKAKLTRASAVHSTGMSKQADLGLVILLEMQRG